MNQIKVIKEYHKSFKVLTAHIFHMYYSRQRNDSNTSCYDVNETTNVYNERITGIDNWQLVVRSLPDFYLDVLPEMSTLDIIGVCGVSPPPVATACLN